MLKPMVGKHARGKKTLLNDLAQFEQENFDDSTSFQEDLN
jgi:hypothetical protein